MGLLPWVELDREGRNEDCVRSNVHNDRSINDAIEKKVKATSQPTQYKQWRLLILSVDVAKYFREISTLLMAWKIFWLIGHKK